MKLFIIAGPGSKNKEFSYGDLEEVLSQMSIPVKAQYISNAKDGLEVKLVKISKNADSQMVVGIENKKLDKSERGFRFTEIKKGLWNNPENDVTNLTNPDVEKVKKPVENILRKISNIYSKYKNSFPDSQGVREAAHHGFIAGALLNFRYRYNLRVYLEQFAGRGYADIVLVPRGKDRSLNAVPIIIELKAGTGTGTKPGDALEQAKGYAKGFQPNTMRVLTVSDNVLCVGLNLDSTEGEKFSMFGRSHSFKSS